MQKPNAHAKLCAARSEKARGLRGGAPARGTAMQESIIQGLASAVRAGSAAYECRASPHASRRDRVGLRLLDSYLNRFTPRNYIFQTFSGDPADLDYVSRQIIAPKLEEAGVPW